MRNYYFHFIFLLAGLSLNAQDLQIDQQQALKLVAKDSTVQKYLATYIDFDEITISPKQKLEFFKDGMLVEPENTIVLKQVKRKAGGVCKVIILINEQLAITTKLVGHSESYYRRKSIYVRDRNWLFSDGQMYYYAFSN